MARYYAGPMPWDRSQYEVTVKTSWYRDRKQWIKEITEWAKEHNMKIEWAGESTHTMDNCQWHEAHFYIPNEQDRMLFALRWS